MSMKFRKRRIFEKDNRYNEDYKEYYEDEKRSHENATKDNGEGKNVYNKN